MTEEISVTTVRVYVPQSSHSHRRQQLQTLLRLLRDQFHVRGLTLVEGMRGIELGDPVQAETVGDVLRRDPDPALIIEFFEDPAIIDVARRMLREMLPECRVIWWSATSDAASVRKAAPRAAGAQ
jgi:hypothetical protein